MGTSLTLQPAGSADRFEHSKSGTWFSVRMQSIERGGFRAEYPIAFAIGSGNHGQGYVVSVGEYLFQSPVAAYRRFTAWDVAPGYEANVAPNFNRRNNTDCLQCHSSAASAPGASQPITCDRCHGDVSRHLANPSRDTIVNQSRLPHAARDSVCEQCHLNGEGRVLNPNADFTDFHAGQPVESVDSVFVYDRQKSGLKVVSHAEQLALSACQHATEKLWCGTCHQPHGDPIDVAARCTACHATRSAIHPKSAESCTACHMPKRKARDGGHSAFTQRNPGLGYMMVGDRATPNCTRNWRRFSARRAIRRTPCRSWRKPSNWTRRSSLLTTCRRTCSPAPVSAARCWNAISSSIRRASWPARRWRVYRAPDTCTSSLRTKSSSGNSSTYFSSVCFASG